MTPTNPPPHDPHPQPDKAHPPGKTHRPARAPTVRARPTGFLHRCGARWNTAPHRA